MRGKQWKTSGDAGIIVLETKKGSDRIEDEGGKRKSA